MRRLPITTSRVLKKGECAYRRIYTCPTLYESKVYLTKHSGRTICRQVDMRGTTINYDVVSCSRQFVRGHRCTMASFMDFVEERDRQWYELLHARDRVRMFVTMELPERAHDGTGEDDDDPSIDYRADGEVPFGELVRTVLRGIRAYVGDPERALVNAAIEVGVPIRFDGSPPLSSSATGRACVGESTTVSTSMSVPEHVGQSLVSVSTSSLTSVLKSRSRCVIGCSMC